MLLLPVFLTAMVKRFLCIGDDKRDNATEVTVRHFSHSVFRRRFRGNYSGTCGSHRIGCILQKHEFPRKMDIVYTILSDSFESFMRISWELAWELALKIALKIRFLPSFFGNLFPAGNKKNALNTQFSRI